MYASAIEALLAEPWRFVELQHGLVEEQSSNILVP